MRNRDMYTDAHNSSDSVAACSWPSTAGQGLANLANISWVSSVGTASSGFASEEPWDNRRSLVLVES